MHKNKNILILQNKILHYRKPLFNKLSDLYDITVLHSGLKTITPNDNYKEIVTKCWEIGPFFYQTRVLREIKKAKYDYVILMFDVRWIKNIIALLVYRKKKFILWGSWLTDNYWADKIKIFFANQDYPSILYSIQAKEQFMYQGVKPDKLFVANNTFHVENREKCYMYPVKNRIIFVGSLDKRKQIDVVFKAFSNICNLIPSYVKLTIIGDGDYKIMLIKLRKELKIPSRVEILDKIDDTNQLVQFYREAIVSVSFGQAGLSVLQSFAYGVPFLTKYNAISGGELTNIINEYNGILCQNNIKSLEENLLKICKNTYYASTLGKNSYEYYSSFCTMEKMVTGFLEALNYCDKN